MFNLNKNIENKNIENKNLVVLNINYNLFKGLEIGQLKRQRS